MPATERNFPLKGALDQLNTKNGETSNQHPNGLYRQLYEGQQIIERRELAYISAPLTSGGALRLEQSVAGGTVFLDNAKTIETIADWISEDNPGVQLFLPQHLEQKGWSQFDYNFFWFCFISGITPDAADYIYKSAQSELDMELLNKPKADYKLRVTEWDKLYYLFEDFWSTAKYLEGEVDPEIHPIAAFIQLPDSQVSIGGQLEARTAEYFHIPVYQISINDRHPDVRSRQSENILSALSSNGPGLLVQPISPVVRFHIIRADLKINPVVPMGDAIQFTLPGVTPLPQDHK